ARESWPNHIRGEGEDRNLGRRLPRGANGSVSARQDDIDLSFHQLGRMFLELLDPQSITAPIDDEILAPDEAEPPQFAKERDMKGRIAWTGEHATETINPSGLLGPRRERPRRGPTDERDELVPFHSITSSARASSVGGTSRPSAVAVLRLIASWYLVGACTGRSAGFSPLRIRST